MSRAAAAASSVEGRDHAAGGVGGAWYWNKYPGARTDSPANTYQYRFSDEPLEEWNWQERYPPQPETERYLNHFADRFDLRKDIRLNTRIEAAIWDEARCRFLLKEIRCRPGSRRASISATARPRTSNCTACFSARTCSSTPTAIRWESTWRCSSVRFSAGIPKRVHWFAT